MQHPTRFLRILYICIILTAVLFAFIFESQMLQYTPLTDDNARYVFNLVAVALTLTMLPLALKIFTFSLPRRQGAASVIGYVRWSVVRLAALSLPLYFDTVSFYLLDRYATCGWMALMVAVMFLFVWPSDGRMRYERQTIYPNEEK